MRTKSCLLGSLVGSTALVCFAGAAAIAGPVGIGPSFKGPVGLQLYSLRDQFKTNVPGTLDEVKGGSIQYAELAGTYGLPEAKFKQELDQRGIQAISAHFGFDEFRTD